MSGYDSALLGIAETLVTGSAPGKPPTPFIGRKYVGTVISSTAAAALVEFPSDPSLGSIQMSMPYLKPQPVAGDRVLVEQLPHQRIILGVISH